MANKKRLKILFIPAWYPSKQNSVAGIFIKEHAKAVSLYNDVTVLYSEGIDYSIKNFFKIEDNIEDGIRTLRLRYRKSPISKTTYFIYLWSIFKVFHKLLHGGWKPDIIHAHVFSAGVPAVILGKICKIPVVITEHYTGFPRHTLGKFNILKARFAMNRAKVILPVSRDLEKAIKSYGIKNRFEIIPNVVNTEIFYPPSQKASNKIKKMLFVALLSPAKGVPYLLQALANLKQKRQDFILDIVGDGPNREEYEKLAQELKLNGMVKFHGLKTKLEIAEFMRNSDFFVLPSLWENLPCVLIEAMASGLPIIASDVGGISEIINKDVGILITSKNIKELINTIDYILDHYQDYSLKMISQYAKENFSYEMVGKKLDEIYKEVIYEKNTNK